MKKYSVLSFLLALAVRISAQLPQGTVAPDFIAQDINGQPWHLYELLDQGKIVVLEISATWCPPCWAYHNGHAMQEFFETHGPEGDNKVQVLFVEGDPATNTDCLYGLSGCNNFSPGNWVTGTTYPYIDDAAISDSFKVSYFPTIFIICPNKKVYEVGQLSADDLWEKASDCPISSGVNNAGIFDYHAGTGLREICDELYVKPSFSLINLGSAPLTAATFNLQWNNNMVQTKQWNGNLPLYGEAVVAFDSLLLNTPGTLKTTLASVNYSSGDDDFSNNVQNDDFTIVSDFNTPQIILKIRTDNYGTETYWEIRDDGGNVVHHGGNSNVGPNGGGIYGNVTPGPGSYGDNVLINKMLTLPGDGCYSILFVDAYGDGMCCEYGNGYYKLYNGNNPAVPILTGGEFGETDHRGFRVATPTGTSVPSNGLDNLQLSPVPASDLLRIEFSLAEPTTVSAKVFNSIGQIVYQFPARPLTATEHTWPLPVDDWPNGTYFIRFQVGENAIARRFVVEK